MSEAALNQETGGALTVLPQRKPTEIRVVNDPIAVLDTGRFEHMQRIAQVMARSNLVPESLCKEKGDDGKMQYLPFETVMANCFLVVNQAVRWNMDPFAVAQSVSVIHGKLCYEGKLIAAVLEAKLGIRLKYHWNEKTGDAAGIEVSGTFSDHSTETVSGTVGDWKTSGTNSPWGAAKNHKRMLAYRGAREWCRLFAPGLMLGVLSDDEIEVLADEGRTSHRHHSGIKPPAPEEEPKRDVIEVRTETVKDTAIDVKKVAKQQKPPAPDAERFEARPIPSVKDEPSAWIDWLDGELMAHGTSENLDDLWNDKYGPLAENLPSGFGEDALAVLGRHSRRLEP